MRRFVIETGEEAARAGIVVVTSAGNVGVNPVTGQVGYAGILSPGNAPSAITVGAARTDDTIASHARLVTRIFLKGLAPA